MAYIVKNFQNTRTIIDSLTEIDFGEIKRDHITENKHFEYLDSYLSHFEAKTLIVETEYIDKDYLDDYAYYYSKCFNNYKKKCVRIHFFTFQFKEEHFNTLLSGGKNEEDIKELQQSYLGFIVFKPIPFTMIGRTCLKTYPAQVKVENRFFPAVRTYYVHLCGIDLQVKSLAFQEQDRTVSACATSSLWSAFQGTGVLFQHSIPSPYEITDKATQIAAHYANRSFPNRGLQLQQMAFAIKQMALEPVLLDCSKDEKLLKAYVNAYLRTGIPVIMAVKLLEEAGSNDERELGLHAVTIAGFRLDEREAEEEKENRLPLLSARISAFYVHDDQVGPFASLKFNNEKKTMVYNPKVSWNAQKDVSLFPSVLLIPGYNKIRVSFSCIYDIINNFMKCVWIFILQKRPELNIYWDIYLTTLCELKKEKFNDPDIKGTEKKEFLQKDLPRYIWVADAFSKDNDAMFSFYFDATDTENAVLFLGSLYYEESYRGYLSEIKSKGILKRENIDFQLYNILQHIEFSKASTV